MLTRRQTVLGAAAGAAKYLAQAALAHDEGRGRYCSKRRGWHCLEQLGRPLMSLFVTEKSENDKYAQQMRSSAGVAVFVSEANDKTHWIETGCCYIETGCCYERSALQAAALGIRNALLNQPAEVAAIRPQFAAWLGVGALRPNLVVRFGRGPTMPMSLRRPVQAVLV